MDFSTRQAWSPKQLTGLAAVLALHLIAIYALTTALGKKVIDVIRQPIETKIIAEVAKPPLPPPELALPPPKMEAPPKPFIPPPEVKIVVPAPVQSTITLSAPIPPPVAVIRPAAPPAPPAPQAVASIGTICTTMVKPKMPRRALRAGIDGTVKARATIRSGKVTKVEILSSQPRGVFDSAVRTAMLQYGCTGDHVADQEFAFKLD